VVRVKHTEVVLLGGHPFMTSSTQNSCRTLFAVWSRYDKTVLVVRHSMSTHGTKGNDNLYKKLLHIYQNSLDLIVLARNEVRRSLGWRDISKTVAQLGLQTFRGFCFLQMVI